MSIFMAFGSRLESMGIVIVEGLAGAGPPGGGIVIRAYLYEMQPQQLQAGLFYNVCLECRYF